MSDTFVNVPVSEDDKRRIVGEDKAWTGPKLIGLMTVSVVIALITLYCMANLWRWQGKIDFWHGWFGEF